MVFETIRRLLARQMEIPEERITPDTHVIEDLGADSLDMMELVTNIEEEYKIIITDEAVASLFTLREISEFIEKLVAKKGS